MNDGGSVLGGNQTASGGTDALNSADLKISHDDAPATSAPETPTTPESTSAEPSTISPTSSPAPFSDEGVLTSADNLEITNENIDEQINEALDSLSVSHDDTTPDANTASDADEEEHVPILPPSSGPAHIFGQEISGITDEDLSSPGTTQAIPTTVFPSVDATATNPEATGDAAQAIAEALNPGQTAAPATTPEQPAAPTQAVDPNQVVDPNQAYAQYGYTNPNQAYAQPEQPAAPAVPYEQQFMEQLHTDPNATKSRKDTGDILINPEIGVRKTRNRLIVGIVIGVLIVIVLGVVAYFSISGGPQNQVAKRADPQAATQQALEAYNAVLQEWDYTDSESNAALDTAYRAFYDLAMQDPAYTDLQTDLGSILNYISFASYVGVMDRYDYTRLLREYLESGYDTTFSSMRTAYDSVGAPQVTKEYLDTMSDYFRNVLDAFDLYNVNDCLLPAGIDMECATAAELAAPTVYDAHVEAYSKMETVTMNEEQIYKEIQSSYDKIKEGLNPNEGDNENIED